MKIVLCKSSFVQTALQGCAGALGWAQPLGQLLTSCLQVLCAERGWLPGLGRGSLQGKGAAGGTLAFLKTDSCSPHLPFLFESCSEPVGLCHSSKPGLFARWCCWPMALGSVQHPSVRVWGPGGRCVEVSRCRNAPKEAVPATPDSQPWQRRLRDDEEEEDLAESGRLFVRNLPFTSTEEDLEKIFSKYGECWPWDWNLQGDVFPLS